MECGSELALHHAISLTGLYRLYLWLYFRLILEGACVTFWRGGTS